MNDVGFMECFVAVMFPQISWRFGAAEKSFRRQSWAKILKGDPSGIICPEIWIDAGPWWNQILIALDHVVPAGDPGESHLETTLDRLDLPATTRRRLRQWRP